MLDVNGYLGISHSGVRGPNSYWVLIKGVTSFQPIALLLKLIDHVFLLCQLITGKHGVNLCI